MKNKKAVLFVPFWRMPGHVGNNRVDRFVRWLAEDGYTIVMIRAGTQEGERTEPWGLEITVVDRLGLHPDPQPGQASAISTRKPNKLRRALAYWLFNPDPTVVWAKASARHPKVLEAMDGAAFILSSSPPESAHVGAWMLSQKTGVPHIMDMRDGWLDEPLKPLLHTSALRRWQERRLESRIAHDAKAIQVTSDVWKELFDARYPQLAHKVHVLTNGYPQHMPEVQAKKPKGLDKEYLLIHAGRFMGSRLSQKPDILLRPLLQQLTRKACKGVICMYGGLSADEVNSIVAFQSKFNAIGWRLECPGAVPRQKMLEILNDADGLLLLSASHAALPSKMFEYMASHKKIIYVVTPNSASEKILKNYMGAIDISTDEELEIFDTNLIARIPDNYHESVLSKMFNDLVRL